jgi:hypothetical protein
MIATNPFSRRRTQFALIAVLSFVLYGSGVFALHQNRAAGWGVEAEGAIPVAVSYLAYGTPLGAVDENVVNRFLKWQTTNIQQILAEAARKQIPHDSISPIWGDGIGVGTDLFVIGAMGIFGLRISSLVLLYLVIIGASAITFVLRYQDRRSLVVPLYFFAATIMLATPLGTSKFSIEQMPIGGSRYFVMAAILPALHICFEFLEQDGAARIIDAAPKMLLLFVQALILSFSILVRSSAIYLMGFIFGVGIWRLFRARFARHPSLAFMNKAAIIGLAFGLWATFVVVTLPAYVKDGRAWGNFWHRSFVGLSFHPAWPYGDLSQKYDCTRVFPKGLGDDNPDHRGFCVWFAYPPNVPLPDSEVWKGIFSGKYEKVLRGAFFYVIGHYPKQVFETYAYDKSNLIANTLAQASNYLFEFGEGHTSTILSFIVVAQAILYLICRVMITVPEVIDVEIILFPVLFLLSLSPLYVAWSNLATSTDAIFFMYACEILLTAACIQALSNMIIPMLRQSIRKQ